MDLEVGFFFSLFSFSFYFSLSLSFFIPSFPPSAFPFFLATQSSPIILLPFQVCNVSYTLYSKFI